MTLTVIPIVALMLLWSFAVVSVTGDLRALIRVQGVYESFGTPIDTAVGQIQIERRLSVEYLGTGQNDSEAALAALMQQQRATDRTVADMRDAIGNRERREDLSERQRQSIDAMVTAADSLEGLRQRVLARTITWDGSIGAYTGIVEPGFDVQSSLTALQAGQMAREAQVVVELVRVREFVSREDAFVAGARATGKLTDRQYDTLAATIEDRRVFHRTYVPDLAADSRRLFAEFERGDEYRALTAGEDALLRAGASRAGEAMAADSWRTTTDRAVKRYMLLCTESALNTADRGRAFAYREMVKAAVVGGLGLVAVALSIWFSMASGRRISRRLEELRDAAGVLASRQLPDVMERLAAGEQIDPAAAAPPLDFGDESKGLDEIGQVGQALNTARLAAVEAAVKQATLRRGVFAVLLNIARRNQALVHRQSKLVDTLERRTSDPDTLEDLFRIDHLTTRMRRHAEGLIILSGATPGRRWRKPVPVVDVVSAAVGEIEDYTRVVVPPMPAVGVSAQAVADVVHLVAELVENAAAFSPPHTQVTMRTSEVRNGFVLEIDDRGLGMDESELDEAHGTLARPGEFDPAQDERLGLYVVGRLAERHGVRVTLTRSPYGGTTAVVLLPGAILAPVDGATPVGGSTPARRLETHARAAQAQPPRTGGPRAGGAQVPHQREGDAATEAGDGHAVGLPRRRRTAGPEGAGEQAGLPRHEPTRDRGRDGGNGEPGPLPQRSRERGTAGDEAEVGQLPRRSREAASDGQAGALRARDRGDGQPDSALSRRGREADGQGVALPQRAPEPGDGQDGRASRRAREFVAQSGEGQDGHLSQQARDLLAQSGESRTDRSSPYGRESGPGRGDGHGGALPHPLPTRVRQASLAEPLRGAPAEADQAPARDVSADEMRAIFGSFQRGLDRGRRGEPAGPGSASRAPRPRTTDEGTDDDV
ncbi:nitrate- and nitrite sensing domain-containing protein [Streptomyces sp. NPDC002889]|uniref:sensor histidine kinase n=1 Tax=Streptomyces sp. NPDC002889 TaxID=3364669 RepID=UPI0036A366D7